MYFKRLVVITENFASQYSASTRLRNITEQYEESIKDLQTDEVVIAFSIARAPEGNGEYVMKVSFEAWTIDGLSAINDLLISVDQL